METGNVRTHVRMDQPLEAAPWATSRGLKACTWIPGAASRAAPSSLRAHRCRSSPPPATLICAAMIGDARRESAESRGGWRCGGGVRGPA